MVDLEILKKFGTHRKKIAEIFTAVKPDNPAWGKLTDEKKAEIEKNLKTRERIQKRIRSRLNEHITWSMKHASLYASADLAWDSSPITKATVPLLQYAQGKINFSTCVSSMSTDCKEKYLQKNEDGDVSLDLPQFFEVNINIIRSFITRRLAAQTTKYNNLWPFYKYVTRSTAPKDKLRGDVLSQRVDMMADQFGYRNQDSQAMRDAFLYAHSVDFLRSSWEVEKQLEPTISSEDFDTGDKDEVNQKARIVKEGVSWVRPHPTRVFWDDNHPLSSINSDTGCEYIGFWDISRYGDIFNNNLYFNKEAINYSSNLWSLQTQYQNYFNQYFDRINPPAGCTQTDPAAANDLKSNIGVYGESKQDASVFTSNYYEKIIPKDEGIGDYPFPVWFRFVVASDDTVIFGEPMPSSVAAYLGMNENDSRRVNISFAVELMPYQDQLTNLYTHLLLSIQVELLRIVTINTDVIGGDQQEAKKHLDYLEKQLQGRNFSSQPIVIKYSLEKMMSLGIDPKRIEKVVHIAETNVSNTITDIFRAITQLLANVERMMAMSPAELGQPAPREISATEVNEIASTTSSVFGFISDAIDDFRAAKKRIIYESLVCCSQSKVKTPTKDRYSKKTIEEAGFEVDPAEDTEKGRVDLKQRTVIGTRKKLIHDYAFSSRDGSERPSNVQAANTLVQLLAQVIPIPGVLNGMGKEKLYEIINEIFRLSGAGVDLLLEIQEGDSDKFEDDKLQQMEQVINELANTAIPQLANAVKNNATEIQKILGQSQESNASNQGQTN